MTKRPLLAVLLTLACLLPLWAAAADSHVRVLAASCAACHGSNGNSVGSTPVLAGMARHQFLERMQGFRDGSRNSTVMHHHAKGLMPEEITQLADYFSVQPRVPGAVPLSLGGAG